MEAPQTDTSEEDSPIPAADNNDPMADAQAAAASMGLTIDEAQELLKQQEDFAELVDLLQDDINFMQAEMPSKLNGEFVLMYKNGNIPKKRDEDIEQFQAKHKNTKVKGVATKLSLKDAEGKSGCGTHISFVPFHCAHIFLPISLIGTGRGQRLANKLERKGYSQVSFSIDGDGIQLMAKKSLDHEKKNDHGMIPTARAAEILELPEGDDDLNEFSLVLTEYEDEDAVKPLHTYGGRKISGNGSQCTTAFSVISHSGHGGITTAAHCTGMNWYDAVPPESDYSTYYQGQHRGWYGDMEWHKTLHIEPAQYYARPNERRYVTSVANSISKGQWVCGYSRMQGTRRCDKVHRTSVSVRYSGLPRMYNLVAMRGMMMIPGDSGGPWSYGSQAFGIVSGGMVMCNFLGIFDCHWRDLWSRASYLPQALGVMVRTT